MALLDTITGTIFIVDSFNVGHIFLSLRIAHRSISPLSQHTTLCIAQCEVLCCFKHTAVAASAALCLLWCPYFFNQASSTLATFLYTGRYMCDRFYVNQKVFSCGPTAQVGPGPPHCSHFYTITQTQTHQVRRLHL